MLQKIAAENNLSETAFVECTDNDDNFLACTKFKLRWFTPKCEVPLCGHATLASAAVLMIALGHPAPALEFITLSGSLYVTRNKNTGLLSMDLPLLKGREDLVTPDMRIDSPLVAMVAAGRAVSRVLYEPSLRYLMVVLSQSDSNPINMKEFEKLTPDVGRMEAAHNEGRLVGVILALEAPPEEAASHDFYSRFFAPWAGINEDPVTGSAHSVLGPYFAEKLGKVGLPFKVRQCSERGGELRVTVHEDRGRVSVEGDAVVVITGELLLDT